MSTTRKLVLLIILIIITSLQVYSQGLWTSKASYGGGTDAGGSSFLIGSKIYYIDGGGDVDPSELWEYDISTNTWTQKADYIGSGRTSISCFAIGTIGYACTGSNSSVQSDCYKYDQSTNTWTAIASFPGAARTGAVGFAIGTKGYVGLGRTCCAPLTDIYEYDPTGNTWTAKTSFPSSARSLAFAFVINSKAYVGNGDNVFSTYYNDMYEFDPSANTWTAKASFPGTARSNSFAFSIGNYGYVGAGRDPSYYKDFYQYDQTSNTWTQRNDFAGTAVEGARGIATATKGYVMNGYDGVSLGITYEYNPNDLATLTTTAVTSVLGTTATSGGNITADGGESVTARGVVWSTSTSPTVALATKTSNGTGSGTFTSSVTGLALNTTYYLRAYATNAIGTSYGSEATFTTLNVPTLTTTAISSITGTTAASGASISNDGGMSVTARGVVWNTSTNPTVALATKTTDGTGTGAFTSSLTGMSFNTTYYVRAYATSSIGTGYGNELSFTTNASAVLKIYEVISNDSTKAEYVSEVVSDGGTPITQRGTLISARINPTISNADFKIIDSTAAVGSYSATFTGLTNGKKYYARSYAINADGISYSPDEIVYTHDNDGIKYEIEKEAPNSGDGNSDGVPDHAQNNVVSMKSMNSTYITLALADNSKELVNVQNYETTDRTGTHTYPYGVNEFQINASSATVTVYYHEVSSRGNAIYRKITPRGEWYAYDRATYSTVSVGGRSVLAVTLELVDGGAGDADGVVNGVIVDPGGLAFPIVPPANIPTLSEWARIAMLSLMLAFGVYFVRKRIS